jgi:hypothetical protein
MRRFATSCTSVREENRCTDGFRLPSQTERWRTGGRAGGGPTPSASSDLRLHVTLEECILLHVTYFGSFV